MADLYDRLFTGVLNPLWESGVKRRPTLSRLAWLERTQWRGADELAALQARALGRLLRHAASTPASAKRRA